MTLDLLTATVGLLMGTVFLAGGVVVWLAIEVRAMQKSTHQVQYVRASSEEFQKFNEDLKKTFEKDFFDNVQ